MAATTTTTNPPPLQPQQPSILPNYPELIVAAIEALNEPKGSNKSAISRQIESTIQMLPASHTTLLTYHLNAMKSSGQLIFYTNNYTLPDPNAPHRRGRGRPRKDPLSASSSSPPNPSPSSPRPRGRPSKVKDPHAPPHPPPQTSASASSGSKRKRGRPPKKLNPAAVAAPVATVDGAKRGRGRPPKAKPPVAAVDS